MKLRQYGVWDSEPGDGGDGYWLLYDTLADAVSANGDGTEVYRLDAKFVGRFKRATVLMRLKKRKARRPKRKPAK